jgi:hypothetical protein
MKVADITAIATNHGLTSGAEGGESAAMSMILRNRRAAALLYTSTYIYQAALGRKGAWHIVEGCGLPPWPSGAARSSDPETVLMGLHLPDPCIEEAARHTDPAPITPDPQHST